MHERRLSGMSQELLLPKDRRLTMGAVAVLLLLGAVALAIPTRPDPCNPHTSTWPGGAVNRDLVNHQHRNASPLPFVNPFYKTFAAWDDNRYRYNALANARLAIYGHGFMERSAKFKFVLGSIAFPAWARTLILTKVAPLWEMKVNENLAANLIRTKIKLEETMGVADFTIEFNTMYPTPSGGMPNQDFPPYMDIGTDGVPYPSGPPPAPGGGEPSGGRNGVLAFWAPGSKRLVFNAHIELAGKWYKDDTGNAADDTDKTVQADKFDFVSCALHEWGHVLGLDHPDPAGIVLVDPRNIMTGDPQHQRAAGIPLGINRLIDADGALVVGASVAAAKNLYTIPARGDMNCDNVVDLLDVPSFVSALLGLGGGCNVNRADTDCNGLLNGFDIPGMLEAILAVPPP